MATKTVILQYQINLTNAAQVAALQNQPMPGGAVGAVIKAPDQAAIDYKPTGGSNLPLIIPPAEFVTPSISSQWFGTGDHFPTNVAKFDRKSGGWFGIPLLFGDTTHYYWRGLFVYSAPLVPESGQPGAPGEAEPISQRRWVDGFELPANGEGGTATTDRENARMASRHADGLGYALRGGTTGPTDKRAHTVAENQAGYTPTRSWERCYVRLVQKPAAATTFWRSHGSVESSTGIALQITPSGQIALNKVTNVGVYELLASTTALDLNRWYRLDILQEFGSGANCKLYLNNVQALNIISFSSGGMATAGRTHVSSEIGGCESGNTLSLDVDDWMCADWPSALNGLDWINGSRMVLVRPQGRASSDPAAWAGDHRTLMQQPATSAGQALTSSTSGGRLAVTTDAGYMVDTLPNTIGCAAVAVGLNNLRAGAANGQLGYKIGAAAEVLATITQSTTQAWQTVLYRPSGLTAAFALAPLELIHTKGADANASSVYGLFAVAEVLGIFGAEDKPTSVADLAIQPGHSGIHNAPYPRSPWAQLGQPPQSPVAIITGTYTGTGAGQDLVFKFPVHFLRIRPLTGDTGGVTWWSSLMGPHPGSEEHPTAGLVPREETDLTFLPADGEDQQQTRYLVRLAGSNSQANAVGVTYSYLAVCDPGMRFLLNGALTGHVGTADLTTALVNTSFLPDFLWLFSERLGATSTARLHVKGPGNAAASVTTLSNAEVANALTMAAGQLVAKTAFYTINQPNQIAFAAFRMNDGSADPGMSRVVQITSYVGDGAASRTLALAPASGRRPMWALVAPASSAGAIFRDPSHTGTTSTQIPSTANPSTGITGAGIDSLSVGTALNGNGVAYNVISFPGDTVAGNNGFSVAGEQIPVDPAPPANGPWDPMPEDPDDPGPVVEPEPEVEPPEGADFEIDCVTETTKIVNIALSRLGITKQLVSVATDNRPEASQARLHYVEAVEATLRAFPWPFATRYADLTLVAGTDSLGVNDDWQYSYRAPSNMLFARRFVKTDGSKRRYDPAPVTFRTGSDASGTLIYTDAAVDDFALEYTVRVSCVATAGDALFRSALAWKLAHELAPGLARDEKKVAFAWGMFERQIRIAEAVAANESQHEDDQPDAPWIEARD